jgi:hypothetical protein
MHVFVVALLTFMMDSSTMSSPFAHNSSSTAFHLFFDVFDISLDRMYSTFKHQKQVSRLERFPTCEAYSRHPRHHNRHPSFNIRICAPSPISMEVKSGQIRLIT